LKLVFILLLIISSVETIAQSNDTGTVIFCKKSFSVPSSCATASKDQIFCADYSMFWIYPGDLMLAGNAKSLAAQMSKEIGNCKPDSIKAFLLDEEINAIKLSCKIDDVPNYIFIAYGIVNKAGVIAIINIKKDPKRNEDIPQPIRQIFKLSYTGDKQPKI